ncbi:hypothetical protein ABZY06_33775 [Streptomyces sp. NPDC006540]|uniref:hypothetical protein n=1 Tax=Streptomyces sp. NPDC006540 TaxID=3155353 RepID=UPI0033B2C2C3
MGDIKVNRETRAELVTDAGQRILAVADHTADKVRLSVPAHNFAEMTPAEVGALSKWFAEVAAEMESAREERLKCAKAREADGYERLRSGGVRGWTAREAAAQRAAMARGALNQMWVDRQGRTLD